MDFKETWRVYTELKEQFDQGRLILQRKVEREKL